MAGFVALLVLAGFCGKAVADLQGAAAELPQSGVEKFLKRVTDETEEWHGVSGASGLAEMMGKPDAPLLGQGPGSHGGDAPLPATAGGSRGQVEGVRVSDPSGAGDTSLTGSWKPMSEWKPMWHPYIVLFWTHVVLALLGTYAAMHRPRVLMGVFVASGLLWPLSWATSTRLWDKDHEPLTADWWMVFIKWLIVDAAAGLPVLSLKAFPLEQTTVERIGTWIYIVLGANIVWTFIYAVDGWVRMWNTMVGAILTLSLAVYAAALIKHEKPFLEMRNGFPYGRATPTTWLICYTIWNAMFVADYSMGMTLQDILFWAMMLLMQQWDQEPHTIDLYFAYARPVQLGIYIALGCWMGIMPFFANAEPLAKTTPLHVNEHSFFLFLNMANFALGCVCLVTSVKAFLVGPPQLQSQKRLTIR